MERKLDINIDNVIDKLLSVRTSKAPKQVNLLEGEIKALCMKTKEIFMVSSSTCTRTSYFWMFLMKQ